MELMITEKNATICLNMIVKDEAHIIKNSLTKLCDKIKFDYWVICDTGSTDNTPQIITDFFKEKGIQGELHYDNWVNFAHNRTLALEKAFKKTQLLLVFDADDEIVGNITMPTDVLFDQYHLKFGSNSGTNYTRVLLINNYKKFEYKSVIHEFISCKEPDSTSTVIEGNYYIVSGRSGSRNLDPNKYLKDALILEKAYEEALQKKDQLFHRYAYYCANSYKDYGNFEDAIKWYKVTLSHEQQWDQEKYTSCLYIYDCYKALNQEFNGFFYLVEAFKYDKERLECLYPLLVHYCCVNMHNVAYNYYLIVKEFYENNYLTSSQSNKLFVVPDKYNFFVPYYMILIADKMKDFKCVIRMYEIVFIKKQQMFQEWYIKNFLYNLQFFLQYIPSDNKTFIPLANDYITFLSNNGINLSNFDFFSNPVYSNYGLDINKFIINLNINKTNKFTEFECFNCKNILIYTGFSDIEWNYTYMLHNALGGSEKAVNYISKCLPTDYNIYISGHVKEEQIDNIHYIHLNKLTKLIEEIPFHTVIVSRYISFYEMFSTCSFYQSIIWAHDTLLLPYGCNLQETQIVKKWNNYITQCVCLTEWHKELFIQKYPELKSKITLINNGIDVDNFPNIHNKVKNRFIYTSRPDRGLDILLQLWPKIIDVIPDATLSIASYGSFPSNSKETSLKNIIDSYENIHYHGQLVSDRLYEEMSIAEYWLYPTSWPETSCITALEMLMSKVICLYYPVAGLPYTLDKYGIQVSQGTEIETIVKLNESDKDIIRENGRLYAESCSWKNRCDTWNKLLNIDRFSIGSIGIPIKIISLERRKDRREKITHELLVQNIDTYELIDAVDGQRIIENNYVKQLFQNNNFYYRKGVIGCALSHYNLFEQLLDDLNHNIYCIFEDDIIFVDNFKEKLNKVLNMFNTDFCLLGGTSITKENKHVAELNLLERTEHVADGTYGYLITKNGAKKMIEYIKQNGITKAIDCLYSQAFEKINVVNQYIVFTKSFQFHNNLDTDIQTDCSCCNFNNNQDSKETWIFYCDKTFKYEVIEDYLNSFKEKVNFNFVNNIDNIPENADKIMLVNSSFDENVFTKFKYSEKSILITEPLNYQSNLDLALDTFKKHPNILFYSYSNTNLRILNGYQIWNTKLLSYQYNEEEINTLKKLNVENDKIYDVGIICYSLDIHESIRKQKVVHFLKQNGYNVNIICGWNYNRDYQLSKCKVILNIHSSKICTSDEHCMIFEHIRCNRLLNSGFTILSEESFDLDKEFVDSYPNLIITKFENLLDINFYKSLNLFDNFMDKK